MRPHQTSAGGLQLCHKVVRQSLLRRLWQTIILLQNLKTIAQIRTTYRPNKTKASAAQPINIPNLTQNKLISHYSQLNTINHYVDKLKATI